MAKGAIWDCVDAVLSFCVIMLRNRAQLLDFQVNLRDELVVSAFTLSSLVSLFFFKQICRLYMWFISTCINPCAEIVFVDAYPSGCFILITYCLPFCTMNWFLSLCIYIRSWCLLLYFYTLELGVFGFRITCSTSWPMKWLALFKGAEFQNIVIGTEGRQGQVNSLLQRFCNQGRKNS